MKTTIGGDRLGSGNKQEISLRNYERSTHDLSYIWRSSMSAGTLVPFMSNVALPGDSFDINLQCEVLTLPTTGPLFGSYKVQLDVFQIPIRLYNAGLHMNRLGIGMDMSSVKLPKVQLRAPTLIQSPQTFDDNEHINSSCIFKYLGISGLGKIEGDNVVERNFNAVPYLAYWDIYKNYYANKQEERGFVIHNSGELSGDIQDAIITHNNIGGGDMLNATVNVELSNAGTKLVIGFPIGAKEPDPTQITASFGVDINVTIAQEFGQIQWNPQTAELTCVDFQGTETGAGACIMPNQNPPQKNPTEEISLKEFPLENIDTMRDQLLQHPFNGGQYVILGSEIEPYGLPMTAIPATPESNLRFATTGSQEGLGLKTYLN